MFTSIITDGSLTIESTLICTLVSIICGTAVAFTSRTGRKNGRSGTNLFISLAVLPTVVQAVIMMVNGNLGAGVAVAGAFSLVRFRSAQGTSREISAIFLAMAAGLASGMGYVTFAIFLTAVVCVFMAVLSLAGTGAEQENARQLKITIPESLDYTGAFDDLFEKYTTSAKLDRVKTTNMGTLFELTYIITIKKDASEKQLIDDIRCRNGNLTVISGRVPENKDEL